MSAHSYPTHLFSGPPGWLLPAVPQVSCQALLPLPVRRWVAPPPAAPSWHAGLPNPQRAWLLLLLLSLWGREWRPGRRLLRARGYIPGAGPGEGWRRRPLPQAPRPPLLPPHPLPAPPLAGASFLAPPLGAGLRGLPCLQPARRGSTPGPFKSPSRLGKRARLAAEADEPKQPCFKTCMQTCKAGRHAGRQACSRATHP